MFSVPVPVENGTLPGSLEAEVGRLELYWLGAGLVRAVHVEDYPSSSLLVYGNLTDAASAFRCDPVRPFEDGAHACGTAVSRVLLPGGLVEVNLTDAPEAAVPALVVAGLVRAAERTAELADAEVVRGSNSERRRNNRANVAALWSLALIVLAAMLAAVAAAHTWCVPRLPLWFVAFGLLMLTLALTAGLFGYLAGAAFFGAYGVVLSAVFGCRRYRARRASETAQRELPSSSSVEMGDSGGGGEEDLSRTSSTWHAYLTRRPGMSRAPDRLGRVQMYVVWASLALAAVLACFMLGIFFFT